MHGDAMTVPAVVESLYLDGAIVSYSDILGMLMNQRVK